VDEKLTPRGAQALAKLTDKWQSAYELREGVSTLRVLVAMGLAEERGSELVGMMFSPQTTRRFRRKGANGD